MKTPATAAITVLAMGWLGACAATRKPATVSALQGLWQMDIDAVPIGARIPTLSVGPNGRLSGKAGVNSYEATLEVEALKAGRFKVGLPRVTRMASTPEAMGLERDFLQRLQRADAAYVDGAVLVLERDGEQILRLFRVGF